MVQPDQNGRQNFFVRYCENKVPALLPPSDWLCPCKKNAIDFLPTILVQPDQNVWGFFFGLGLGLDTFTGAKELQGCFSIVGDAPLQLNKSFFCKGTPPTILGLFFLYQKGPEAQMEASLERFFLVEHLLG